MPQTWRTGLLICDSFQLLITPSPFPSVPVVLSFLPFLLTVSPCSRSLPYLGHAQVYVETALMRVVVVHLEVRWVQTKGLWKGMGGVSQPA